MRWKWRKSKRKKSGNVETQMLMGPLVIAKRRRCNGAHLSFLVSFYLICSSSLLPQGHRLPQVGLLIRHAGWLGRPGAGAGADAGCDGGAGQPEGLRPLPLAGRSDAVRGLRLGGRGAGLSVRSCSPSENLRRMQDSRMKRQLQECSQTADVAVCCVQFSSVATWGQTWTE